MIWTIAKKEFLLNVVTFKFAVAMGVCVVLAAVFTPILARDYQQRATIHSGNVARNEAQLQTVKAYKNITPTVFRPPSVLSIFSEGLEKRISDSAVIEWDKIPEMRAAAAQGNSYQSIFPIFDISLIFRVVISILALLVAYDAISGERERGTLKLMLAGAARRHQLLLAKLLAGLLVLVVPITTTFLVVLLVLRSFSMVQLTRPDWVRIALMYLSSLLLISAMYNLGLLFSCLTRKSAVALVLGVFAWVVFVVVVPNASVYFASEWRPLEPEEARTAQIKAIQQQYQLELARQRPRDDPNIVRVQSDAGDAFNRSYHQRLNKAALEFALADYRVLCTLGNKYADQFWQVEHRHLNALFAQHELARKASRVSPVSLYEDIMSALAGTDVARHQSFVAAIRAHRNQIFDFIRSRTAEFTSPALFTPYTLEEMERLSRGAQAPALDLRDLPEFTCGAETAGGLAGALAGMAALLLTNLVLISLSLVAFTRYDVR